MNPTSRLAAGGPFPAPSVARRGDGEAALVSIPGCRLIVLHRGRRCPPRKTCPIRGTLA